LKIRMKRGLFSLVAATLLSLAALGTGGLRAAESGAGARSDGGSYAQIEPMGLALMTAGLVGLGLWARHKRRKP